MSGYFYYYREWDTQFPFPKGYEYTERDAYVYLWKEARHTVERKYVDGKLLMIGIGELITTQKELAKTWSWDARRVGKFLNQLKNCGGIGIERCTRVCSRITINDYADLQAKRKTDCSGDGSGECSGDGSGDGNRPAFVPPLEPSQVADKRPLINKGKKVKKKEEKYIIPEDFSVTPELRAWVIKTFGSDSWIDLDLETKMFVEYWGKTGEKRPGWDLTWKNRIKSQWERKQEKGGVSKPSTSTGNADSIMAQMKAQLEGVS